MSSTAGSENPQQSQGSQSQEQQSADKISASILKERRFKLSRACDRCRRRRIKCDEGHPCQSCMTSNSACTFEEPGKRTHPHKSKRAATLEDRMHHLETLIQAIPPAVFAAGGSLNHTVNGNGSVPAPVDLHIAHASFASSTHTFPAGIPPPSLSSYPLINPSVFFGPSKPAATSRHSSPNGTTVNGNSADRLAEETARMSLSPSYLYLDDEGYTRWQGEASGLPLLDLLVERHKVVTKQEPEQTPLTHQSWSIPGAQAAQDAISDWFPDRQPRRTENNPEVVWKLITSFIAPDLMDSLVQCYLSTSYYLMPFLHVPSFLADYGNPRKWGEPGFAAFIVAVCCLSSRHVDDPRVRSDPSDGNTAGMQWFELFGRLRTLPTADRPTVYTVQSVLVAGVYAVGLGKLSKAFALLAESITLSVDAGLHRSADAYDYFDPIEDEVRKRTFWCVYMWDKQACAHFGRPPMIRLRDCDVGEPAIVDDECITHDGIGPQPADHPSRMSPFVSCLRVFVVLESVLDGPPSRHFGDGSSFLTRATSVLTGFRRSVGMRDEEIMLDEICSSIPPYWAHSAETMASGDVIRVTQAERLHCAEQFVRMLLLRHRFSEMVAERSTKDSGSDEQSEAECEAMRAAQACALQIVSSHIQIAAKGLMTYYGVHVIHQLTAAGRTLVAILINCHADSLRPLIAPALEALRSCVGLLRRFSGRYVCGMRSGDLMEEFCRLTQIPLESPRPDGQTPMARSRPPWIRPIRKKTTRSSASNESGSQHGSPEGFSPQDAFLDLSGGGNVASPSFAMTNGLTPPSFTSESLGGLSAEQMTLNPSELFAMFGGDSGSIDVASLLMSPQQRSLSGAFFGPSSEDESNVIMAV
ncbi:fungal-specific transcription factor domain-containing protein [Cytidiella melzeri]|nr:fungal-specific transcription factor domain-containing protein [Cytidiella melzeri]